MLDLTGLIGEDPVVRSLSGAMGSGRRVVATGAVGSSTALVASAVARATGRAGVMVVATTPRLIQREPQDKPWIRGQVQSGEDTIGCQMARDPIKRRTTVSLPARTVYRSNAPAEELSLAVNLAFVY